MRKLKYLSVTIEAGGKHKCQIYYALDKDGKYQEYIGAGDLFLREILYTECKYVIHSGERLEISNEPFILEDIETL